MNIDRSGGWKRKPLQKVVVSIYFMTGCFLEYLHLLDAFKDYKILYLFLAELASIEFDHYQENVLVSCFL